MSGPTFPITVRTSEPITATDENDREQSICAGTVLDVLHIERADPSVGIWHTVAVVTDPTDIGNELFVDGIEFSSQEWNASLSSTSHASYFCQSYSFIIRTPRFREP